MHANNNMALNNRIILQVKSPIKNKVFLARSTSNFDIQGELLLSRFKFFVPAQTRWTDNNQNGVISTSAYADIAGTIFSKSCLRLGIMKKTVPFSAKTRVITRNPFSFPQIPLIAVGLSSVRNSGLSAVISSFIPKHLHEPFQLGLNHNGKFAEELDMASICASYESEASMIGNSEVVFVNLETGRPSRLSANLMAGFEKLLIEV